MFRKNKSQLLTPKLNKQTNITTLEGAVVLWKKFWFETWLPLNVWVSSGQRISVSKFRFPHL